MSEEQLHINPNDFAMKIIGQTPKDNKQTNQQFIKSQLTLYLEAYYLIKDFNHLEVSQLEQMKQQQISELFDKMLSGRFSV